MKRNLLFKVLCVFFVFVCALSGTVSVFAEGYVEIQRIDPETGIIYSDFVDIPDRCDKPSVVSISETSVKIGFYGMYINDDGGYEISIYNNGTYTPVKNVAEDYSYRYTATVSGLSGGKTYNIAVRAYNVFNGVYYYGDYSDILTVCTAPAAVTLSKVSYVSQGKIKVKWKKKSGVSGYIVQYSTSKKFADNGRTTSLTVKKASSNLKEIGGLAGTTYYVRVCAYKELDGVRYCGKWSKSKSIKVKKGLNVKQLLNSVKTDNSGRKEIKSLTKNGVDIAKYKTTYDKVKAIYNWHAKHYSEFAHCLACNASFNSCLYALYSSKEKAPDIWIAAGEVKNNDGSKVIHKWSVLYLAGVPYIFDPRLQGYTKNYTGNMYFGVSKGSRISKIYIFDAWYARWTKESVNVYCK